MVNDRQKQLLKKVPKLGGVRGEKKKKRKGFGVESTDADCVVKKVKARRVLKPRKNIKKIKNWNRNIR